MLGGGSSSPFSERDALRQPLIPQGLFEQLGLSEQSVELDLPFQTAVIRAPVSFPGMGFIFWAQLPAAPGADVRTPSSTVGMPSKCFQQGSDVQILRDHLPDQI